MDFIRKIFFSGASAQPSPRQEVDLESQSLVSDVPFHANYGSTAHHLGDVAIAQQAAPAAPPLTRTPAYHYQIPHRNTSVVLARTNSVSTASGIAAPSGSFNSHSVTPAPTSLARAQATFNEAAHQVVQQAQHVQEYLNDREAEKMITPYRAVNVDDLDMGRDEQLWNNNPSFAASAKNYSLTFGWKNGVVPTAAPKHFLTPAENQRVRTDFRKALVAFYGKNLVEQYEAPQIASADVAERAARSILSNDLLTIGETSSVLMELNEKAKLLLAENAPSLPPACRVMKRKAEQRAGTLSLPPEVAQIKKIVDDAEEGLRSFRNSAHILASKKDSQGRPTNLYPNLQLTETTSFNLDAEGNICTTNTATSSPEINQQVRGRFRESYTAFYGEVLTNELLGKLEEGAAESTKPLTLGEVNRKLSQGDQAIQEIKSFFEEYPTLSVSHDTITGGETITLEKKETANARESLSFARSNAYEALGTPAQNFINIVNSAAELVGRGAGVVGGAAVGAGSGFAMGELFTPVVVGLPLALFTRTTLHGALAGLGIGVIMSLIANCCDEDFVFCETSFNQRSFFPSALMGALLGGDIGMMFAVPSAFKDDDISSLNAMAERAGKVSAGIGAVGGGIAAFHYFRPDLAASRIYAATAHFQAKKEETRIAFFAAHRKALESVDAAIQKVEGVLNRFAENDPSRIAFEREKRDLMRQREELVRQGAL